MALPLPWGTSSPPEPYRAKLQAWEMQTALPTGCGMHCPHFRRVTPRDGTGLPPSEGARACAGGMGGALLPPPSPYPSPPIPGQRKTSIRSRSCQCTVRFRGRFCFGGFVVVLALHVTTWAPSAILRPSRSRMEGKIHPRRVWALSVIALPAKDNAEDLVLEYSDRQSHARFTLLLERAAWAPVRTRPGPAPWLGLEALTWHAAGPLLAAAPGGRLRSLGIAFVELPLEYTQEAGDPVVQPHIENELKSQVETETFITMASHL